MTSTLAAPPGTRPTCSEVSGLSADELEWLLGLSAEMKQDPAGWLSASPEQTLACFFEAVDADAGSIGGRRAPTGGCYRSCAAGRAAARAR